LYGGGPGALLVKTLSGKTIILEWQSGWTEQSTILDVKTKVKELEGISSDDYYLSFNGRILEESLTLLNQGCFEGVI
jgi:hypothetical protein